MVDLLWSIRRHIRRVSGDVKGGQCTKEAIQDILNIVQLIPHLEDVKGRCLFGYVLLD